MRKKTPQTKRQDERASVRGSELRPASVVRHGSLAKRIIKGRRGRNKKVVVVRGRSSGTTTRFDSDHLYDPQSMSRAKKGERGEEREDSIELSTSLSRKIPRSLSKERRKEKKNPEGEGKRSKGNL